ncbi:hypothetical protein IFT84_09210 [Rhizobium sp. CFBP 8762]|uniref:hypothetical protein n=1 Tax=Rhizobium sp. CFBP 8762 TaxID=2775279 RepID=UPI001784F78B|nr:hypothetical protein [Rhizobium sp. CFBP 8762]MBD8554702.1 hypothetical protein [Rhizobium sp. CFBP 8762]
MRPFSTLSLLALCACAATLASCQSRRAPVAPPVVVSRAPLATMERVALSANACWFKSGDPAFRNYRLAPELNSFSGRPRILIVHRNSPESRPLAVVQAEGSPAQLAAFGPLLSGPNGARMSADVNRWAAGAKGC